jgi:hypothetical protein
MSEGELKKRIEADFKSGNEKLPMTIADILDEAKKEFTLDIDVNNPSVNIASLRIIADWFTKWFGE